jgi:hypothetical protein
MNVNASAQPKVAQRSPACSAQIIVLAVTPVAKKAEPVLWRAYCSALGLWHSSQSGRNGIAVLEAYSTWAVAHLGEADAEPVIAAAAQVWGVP